MSGRAAKANRRVEHARMAELIAQAHNQLHAGDPFKAHELLHEALGESTAPPEYKVKPLQDHQGFDKAFRRLAASFGIQAAYVSVGGTRPEDGAVRLLGGGDATLSQLMDMTVRRVITDPMPTGEAPEEQPAIETAPAP